MTTVQHTETPRYDKEAIRVAAAGRWPEILSAIGGIPLEYLDGTTREHPCPICGGETRFRMIDVQAGAVYCNQCFNKKNGDGFAAFGWATGKDFNETLASVAHYLGIEPSENGNGKPTSSEYDPVARMAETKRCPVDSLRVYGATPFPQRRAIAFPMYGRDGKQCSQFNLFPDSKNGQERKGLNAQRKPTGMFLPHDEAGNVRLPKPGESWIPVEGVKDASVLHALGFLAVGLPGKYFKAEWAGLFQGVNVVVLLDNDAAGIEAAPKVVKAVQGNAASVAIATLPHPGDVRDNLAKPDGEAAVRQAIETATSDREESRLEILTVAQLAEQFPRLRKPLIDGVLREGETCNVISSPKMGKSWLVSDLALSVVTGRPWLDLFEVKAGKVLVIDNELHGNTISYRIQKVGAARDILFADYRDSLHVANLRGKLTDIYQLGPRLFDRIEPDTYRLVIIDAFYRAIPEGVDENSNSQIAQVYNQIDAYALQLGCGFICIHHTTKGNQSGKSITDVGSGAGSQSRATDTHLILRPHAEPGAVVLEAAARSWPPIDPVALRWDWPLWTVANDLDSDDLKPEREGRQAKERERKQAEHCERVIEALRELGGQETKRQIKIAASLNSDNFDRAVFRLMRKRDAQEPQIEAIDIVKRNRKYPGLRLLEQGNGTDGTDGTNQDTQLLSR